MVLRVRKQAKPGYSPYSKEQVLLATLRCVLDTVRATPRNPLVIKVLTEDEENSAMRERILAKRKALYKVTEEKVSAR